MPIEKVQALLESLLYTLSFAAKQEGLTTQALLEQDFASLIDRGRQYLSQRKKELQKEWQSLCLSAPRINNVFYVDTLQGVGSFFKKYDMLYAAQQIPCCIDYPLLAPVSEQLKGISYIDEYLKRLGTENEFINCFDSGAVSVLLHRSECRESYFNICEPILANALGKCLLNKSLPPLTVGEDEIELLNELFEGRSRQELALMLWEALVKLSGQVGFDSAKAGYFSEAINSLAVRLEIAVQAGNTANIFTLLSAESVS